MSKVAQELLTCKSLDPQIDPQNQAADDMIHDDDAFKHPQLPTLFFLFTRIVSMDSCEWDLRRNTHHCGGAGL